MFNIYVVLADHDTVTAIAGLPRAGASSKPRPYKQRYKKRPHENMGFHWKTVWRFQMEKRTEKILHLSKNWTWPS